MGCGCGSSNRNNNRTQMQPRPSSIPVIEQGTNQILLDQIEIQNITQQVIQQRINAEAQKRNRLKLQWKQ